MSDRGEASLGSSPDALLDCCTAQSGSESVSPEIASLALSQLDPADDQPPQSKHVERALSLGTGSAVVFLDKRSLIRDCLVRYFRTAMGLDVIGVGSLEECVWLAKAKRMNSVLLSLPGDLQSDANRELISRAREVLHGIPFLVLCDTLSGSQELAQVKPSLCISTSMPLDVAFAAIRVMQSRSFVEHDSSETVAAAPEAEVAEPPSGQSRLMRYFTTRQIAVIEALRKGKANKIIAYELNMKESTVKVHVRNIMRRLKASNRTEASYIASQLVNGGGAQYLRSLAGMDPFAEEAP